MTFFKTFLYTFALPSSESEIKSTNCHCIMIHDTESLEGKTKNLFNSTKPCASFENFEFVSFGEKEITLLSVSRLVTNFGETMFSKSSKS